VCRLLQEVHALRDGLLLSRGAYVLARSQNIALEKVYSFIENSNTREFGKLLANLNVCKFKERGPILRLSD
jgi:hypothetical protein